MTDLTAQIDALADARDRLTAVRLEWEACRDRILEPLRGELADLDAEYGPRMEAAQQAASDLESAVRAAVLVAGTSVKGSRLHVIWQKGRESWDSKGLAGYAVAHPELLKFRKEGEPSVAVRNI